MQEVSADLCWAAAAHLLCRDKTPQGVLRHVLDGMLDGLPQARCQRLHRTILPHHMCAPLQYTLCCSLSIRELPKHQGLWLHASLAYMGSWRDDGMTQHGDI